MQAIKRPNISLIDLMMLDNIRIGQICPVVAPDRPLIWCPTSEAMHQDDRIVIRPFRARQMVITSAFVAMLGLSVQSSFLTIV